jgi:hypothetical protein
MAEKEKIIEKFRAGCRKTNSRNTGTNAESKKDLFDREWEVFVIKRDEGTGKLIGRTACCALSPV